MGCGPSALFNRHVLVCMYWSACTGLHGLVCMYWSACTGLHVLVCMYWSACTGLHVLVCMYWSVCTGLHVLVCLYCCRAACQVIVSLIELFTICGPFPQYIFESAQANRQLEVKITVISLHSYKYLKETNHYRLPHKQLEHRDMRSSRSMEAQLNSYCKPIAWSIS